jgi:hypothetical protein
VRSAARYFQPLRAAGVEEPPRRLDEFQDRDMARPTGDPEAQGDDQSNTSRTAIMDCHYDRTA